jgi:hypothetical protein
MYLDCGADHGKLTTVILLSGCDNSRTAGYRARRVAGFACAIMATAAIDGAIAEFALLRPLKDATLVEDPAGAFANGSGPGIFSGRINAASRSIRRSLVAFDVAAVVPPGSTVTGARLRLNLSSTSGGATWVGIHRLLADWGEGPSLSGGGGGAPATEGDATWIHRFHDDQFWALPGGDFDPVPRAAAIVDQAGPYLWEATPEMTADIQTWLDHPGSNFGWILLGDETRPQTVKRFDSREHPEAALRPLLEIDFVPPCAPDPRGPGYWSRRCAARAGGEPGHPGSGRGDDGRGPGIDDGLLFCAARTLGDLGLPGIDACDVLLSAAPRSCEDRALRRLAVLVLNVCAGRLQTSCPAAPGEGDCAAPRIGDRLREISLLIGEGECWRAAGCAGTDD